MILTGIILFGIWAMLFLFAWNAVLFATCGYVGYAGLGVGVR